MTDRPEDYNEHYQESGEKNYWPVTIYMICAVGLVVWLIFS